MQTGDSEDEDSEERLRIAISLDERVQLNFILESFEQAENFYNDQSIKQIKKSRDKSREWENVAQMQHKYGDYENAFTSIEKAIQYYPCDFDYWELYKKILQIKLNPGLFGLYSFIIDTEMEYMSRNEG
jgi:tetratricopeptide (TPR) repeat protein